MKKEILFQCVIPGRPGILKNSKKICRNRRTGAVFMKASDKYEIWAEMARRHIEAQSFRALINEPVNLQVHFYFENHQWEPDLSNAYQGIEDLLQKCGVLMDDKLVYSHDGSRKIFGAKVARCEVTLTLASPEPDEAKGNH